MKKTILSIACVFGSLFSNAQSGAAISLDGSDDYIDIGTAITQTNSYTKEAWIYANASGSNNIISSANSPFWLAGGQLSVAHGWGSGFILSDPSSFPLNVWTHVAVTFDGPTNTLILYKNGVLMATSNSAPAYVAENIQIGAYGASNFFQGMIDEVRLWDVVRTQCEINSYMNCEIPSSSTGLVANYHFNQGIASANNSSETSLTDATGNNPGALINFLLNGPTSNWVSPGGVISGNIIPSVCPAASALNFDGSDDYVMTSSNITHGNQFTYEAWINPMSANGWGGIMTTSSLGSQAQWVQVTLNSAGALRAEIVDDAGNNKWYEGNTSLVGAWHHIAVSFDGTNLLFYVDGNIETTSAINNGTLGTITINSQLNIGAERNHNAFYSGDIDEVRVWNVVRSQCEIFSYKNCEIPATATGLVANYHFNQGFDMMSNPSITTLTDASGNANDGTLSNFDLTSNVSNWVAPGGVVSGYTTTLAPPVITVNSGAICSGQSFTMTPGGAMTYTFSNGSAVATPTADATYSVSGTDAYGCVSSIDAISSVTVNICTPAAALNFDGADDFIAVNAGTSADNLATNELTIEAWVYVNNYNDARSIVRKDGDYNFYLYNGNVYAEVWPNGMGDGTYMRYMGSTSISINAWTHVAFTYNKTMGSAMLYVNGVPENVTPNGNFIPANGPLQIGVSAVFGNPFVGLLDEVRIWNTERSQCDINTYMGCEIPGSMTNLLVNYDFNQGFDAANNGSETVLVDASGNMNNGTLTNFALTGTTSNWVAPGGVISGYSITLAPPTITVNSGAICSGSSFTMIPTGATTYTFSSGTDIVSPTADASYSVSGTATTGCISLMDAVSSVTVNVSPVISVNSGAICSGSSFTMIPTGAMTYTYSNGSDIATPTTDATYSVSGTDANGCVSSIDAIASVTVNTLPMIMATTNNTLLCTGQTATLSVTGASSYTWSTTETTMNIVVTPTAQTTYTVDGTDANGCSNTTTITQDVSLCTGIALITTTDASLINLYPNPNNGLFILELTTTSQVTITNALGQTVFTKNIEIGKHNLDIQDQSTGIYFVKVILGDKQHMIKLIKE